MVTDEKLAAYLAGEMAADEREAFEMELLADEGARGELRAQQQVSAGLRALLAPDHERLAQAIMATAHGLSDEAIGCRVVACEVPACREASRSAPVWWLWPLAAAALVVAGLFSAKLLSPWGGRPPGTASRESVARLSRTVAADFDGEAREAGQALAPGWLRLKSGLAQVVFYSGARVAIEGPAEFQIISPSEASCRMGRLTAEVPPQARGFRIATPQMNVTDLGTAFGLDVKAGATELHVFKGSVEFLPATGSAKQSLQEGSGAVAEGSRPPRLITANEAAFASLFKLRDKSVAAESWRYDANFARPIELGPDDVRAFPDAPAGFDKPRPGVESGRVEAFAYDSTVTGTRRKTNVYLPPGYSSARKYPVLYLLHGLGGNQHEWTGYIHADTIIGNLVADGKAVPMIVVMPNGRALPDDRPPAQIYTPQNAEGFAKFERDLLDCLIPAIQAKYSVNPGREHRALAGLSTGGGQTLNFGLGHLDTFAWVGGFSSAPNTRPGAELVPDPAAARRQLKLLYLSCGNKDGLISISQGVHAYFKQQDIAHVWNVDDHGHDGGTWGNNLYHFAQQIFRP